MQQLPSRLCGAVDVLIYALKRKYNKAIAELHFVSLIHCFAL